MNKRLERGAIDMPQVCEGCTSETKVKLLAKRGTFFEHGAVGAPTGERTDGKPGAEKRSSNGPLREKSSPFG